MHPREIRIDEYNYDLPDERIAAFPLTPRDSSKLLQYKDGTITDHQFSSLPQLLPAGCRLLFNQTKVIHARLVFTKPSGGTIETFCLEPDSNYPDIQTAMLQRGQVYWNCLVGGAKKWKAGAVLQLSCGSLVLAAEVRERFPTHFVISFSWNQPELTFAEVLHLAGKVPLPPYINRDLTETDEATYQTVYARNEGSVAAPTAGLHFTPAVMAQLEASNVSASFITLHVGAGTFMPVKSDTMAGHNMHAEWLEITREAIEQLLAAEAGIVAVGTTSLRTLETLYHIGNRLYHGLPVNWNGLAITQWMPYEMQDFCTRSQALQAVLAFMGQTNTLITRTQIIIAPGYTFRMADGLVTNFHQPCSTLLLLVSALIGEDWKKVYGHALDNEYRFLSYGDSSLLWRNVS
jgi:S-adenosylmethionine:tRNA ribosyltransferase-isomerase